MALEARGVAIDQPRQLRSEMRARCVAEGLAASKVGVIAFSRTGSPAIGEWVPAVIIARYGTVGQELIEFLSAT